MKMDASSINLRSALRAQYKKVRENLPIARRKFASGFLFSHLLPILPPGKILSYASFGHELGIWAVNEALFKEGRLVLPQVCGGTLVPRFIPDLSLLEKSPLWEILEPTTHCPTVHPLELSAIVVPGLTFGPYGHRLGYGKGYWDRFLSGPVFCPTFGLCFKEQLHKEALPKMAHDIPVTRVIAV